MGIRRINHVFLPITKYLSSIAFLGAPNFPQISIECSAHSIPGGVAQTWICHWLLIWARQSPSKSADVRKAGTSVQKDLMVVIGFWLGKLHPAPDASGSERSDASGITSGSSMLMQYIVEGDVPAKLTVQTLKSNFPSAWEAQRIMFT